MENRSEDNITSRRWKIQIFWLLTSTNQICLKTQAGQGQIQLFLTYMARAMPLNDT